MPQLFNQQRPIGQVKQHGPTFKAKNDDSRFGCAIVGAFGADNWHDCGGGDIATSDDFLGRFELGHFTAVLWIKDQGHFMPN